MNAGRRTDLIVLSVLGAAAALLVVWLITRSFTHRTDPLVAVPARSFLVVTIDVLALAHSPLGAALVNSSGAGARTGEMLGVDSISATCGFDPLHHLQALAVSVPEGGEHGDFGVTAASDLTRQALTSCATALVAKRGGKAEVRQEGTFTVVANGSARGEAAVAFRDGGPLLVGRGTWLQKMMDTAEGREPALSPSSAQGALRSDLATRDLDAQAVVASAILPRVIRDRLHQEMAAEASEGKGVGAMDGVLGVAEVAVGLHAGTEKDDARLVGELRCDSASACESVSKTILHARLGWSGNLGYRLLGLGPLIDNLTVHQTGSALVVQTRAPASDLAKLVDRALAGPAPRPKSSASPALPSPSSSSARGGGELVRRPGGGGK